MQHSRVCISLLTRCLIRPSGERSHGMSLALMTFGNVAYSARNFSDSTIASARKLLEAAPDRAACLSSNKVIVASPLVFLIEHDLFGKPVSTFPDHAQISVGGWNSLTPGGSLSVGHSTIFWNNKCMNRNSGLALNTRRMQDSFSSSLKC